MQSYVLAIFDKGISFVLGLNWTYRENFPKTKVNSCCYQKWSFPDLLQKRCF